MNIFEKSKKENKSLIDSIHEVLKYKLNIDIDNDRLSEIISDMGLFDYIELNNALNEKNIDYIKQIFGEENVFEYSIQGRQNLRSTASSRPKPASNRRKTSSDSGAGSSSSPAASSTDKEPSSADDTSNTDKGSLSPQEYRNQKELKTSIDNEIDELEKMKRLAGIS